MKNIIVLLFLTLFFASCADTTNNKLIIGNWQGAEWLINGRPSDRNVAATTFTFNDKGSYTFNYGFKPQSGTYKVENDMLFTKPTGEQEIMVKISKLTKDSMTFIMNRGGTDEMLTLIRAQ